VELVVVGGARSKKSLRTVTVSDGMPVAPLQFAKQGVWR